MSVPEEKKTRQWMVVGAGQKGRCDGSKVLT